MVLMIMAILSVYAVPKTVGNAELTLHSQAQLLASDLSRLQWMATTSNSSICVAVNSGQYSAHPYNGNCLVGSDLLDPTTRSPYVVSLPASTTLTDLVSPTPLYFNSLGQPSRSGTFRLLITGATSAYDVHVTPVTGWIFITDTP